MSFTLGITNAPAGGTHWSAHFYSKTEGRFISPSPTPTIGEVWECPYNPYGATDLRVLVLDFVNARTVHDQGSLGPIYDGRSYIYDCSTRQLSEVAPEEEYTGSLVRKELEYNESRASIPVYDIPQDERGLVHIWGRNDMTTTQALGIGWVIFDPDGVVVEEYNDWSFGHGPGDDHEFIGGRFNINKVGTYKISVVLKMSPPPAYPTAVDTYYGTLCTVAAPEYRGTIAKKELEYNESRRAIPVY